MMSSFLRGLPFVYLQIYMPELVKRCICTHTGTHKEIMKDKSRLIKLVNYTIKEDTHRKG
jgi:hypothetical protein